MTFSIRSILSTILFFTVIGTTPAVAKADTLRIEIDTSSFGQSGWLDLVLTPSNHQASSTSAVLSNFIGFSSAGVPEITGNVTGSFSSDYVLHSAAEAAGLFHAVNFGSKISFDVDFSGALGSAINRSLSTLSVALYGVDQTTLLGNGDPATGSLLHLYWLPPTVNAGGSVTSRVFDPVASVDVATAVSPVPEPSAWLTMAAGLGLLAVVRRRKAV